MQLRVFRAETSWIVAVTWAVLSTAVAIVSVMTVFQPAWFATEDGDRSFGPVLFCQRDTCVTFLAPEAVASPRQLTCIFYGGGCVLLCACAAMAMVTLVVRSLKWRHQLFSIVGYLQAVAIVLQAAGLLIFPLSLDSTSGKIMCGEHTKIYSPGDCSIGWSYLIAISTTVNALYGPVLARLAIHRIYESDYWSNINFM